MNCPAVGLRVASVIFGLMGLAHLFRIIVRMSLQVGACHIGQRWSAAAFIILVALCAWMWRLASKADGAKSPLPPYTPAA